MNEAELLLVKEGLKLADDALASLMQVDNEHVSHLAGLLHSVLWFGEKLLDGEQKNA